MANILKSLKTLGEILDIAEDLFGLGFAYIGAWMIQNVARAEDVFAELWTPTSNAKSYSGIHKFDFNRVVADVIWNQNIIEDVARVDAEFYSEAVEEAFSNAVQVGIGGAAYIDAAISSGMYPYQSLHNPTDDPIFDAMADVTTGIYWVNALHARIENALNDLMRGLARYEPMIGAVESLIAPMSVFARIDPIAAAAQQIVQNIMDAVNALYARITEALSAYLSARDMVERGYAGAEAEQEMRVRLIAAVDSAIENIAMLEDEVAQLQSIASEVIDANDVDEAAANVDEALYPALSSMWRDALTWLDRIMLNRLVKTDATVVAAIPRAGGTTRLTWKFGQGVQETAG